MEEGALLQRDHGRGDAGLGARRGAMRPGRRRRRRALRHGRLVGGEAPRPRDVLAWHHDPRLGRAESEAPRKVLRLRGSRGVGGREAQRRPGRRACGARFDLGLPRAGAVPAADRQRSRRQRRFLPALLLLHGPGHGLAARHGPLLGRGLGGGDGDGLRAGGLLHGQPRRPRVVDGRRRGGVDVGADGVLVLGPAGVARHLGRRRRRAVDEDRRAHLRRGSLSEAWRVHAPADGARAGARGGASL
mmetsp:Transcript_79663/g.223465  ORF Transcript_79663/g.223465 Transcript_79663/m.223465 type:complete len:245 (-) Transcript_79663:346-1080(-)